MTQKWMWAQVGTLFQSHANNLASLPIFVIQADIFS